MTRDRDFFAEGGEQNSTGNVSKFEDLSIHTLLGKNKFFRRVFF